MTTKTFPEQSLFEATIEPHTQAWLDKLSEAGGPPLYELTPQEARDVLRAVQASVPVVLAPAEIEDRVISTTVGDVTIRIVRPQNATGPLPIILHTHGGGWILGDRTTHERLYRELANLAMAVVVFVEYTPAPEGQYPLQLEQAYAALEWAVSNAREFGADGSRVALFGDSVGGNMAAVLTLLAKQRGGPKLRAQALVYPVTDADLNTDSYDRYAEGPWLTRGAMQWFWDSYLPDEEARLASSASPLRATEDELRGLPSALIINGENDVLRDEGEAYARKLAEAGVSVTQVRYAGTVHDFLLLNPITDTPAPRAAVTQVASYLHAALAR
jgi:acetyl esterase